MKLKSPAAGALLGIICFVVFTFVGRIFEQGNPFRGSGLGQILLGAIILGVIVGVVVGAVVDRTRTISSGLIAGAIVVALIHGFNVTIFGLRGGFRIAALIWGAIYGAIASWIIGSSILQGIEKEESQDK